MTDMAEIDFVILSRVMNEDDQLTALQGRVVEDGEVREEPLEISVPQIIKYIGRGGLFHTARKTEQQVEVGGKLEVLEEDEQYRLRTVEGTAEEYQLGSLPPRKD